MNSNLMLREMASLLNRLDIPFMLTGSLAAALYGPGRSTMDFDLVIQANRAQLQELVQSCLEAGWYASDSAALEALRYETGFNVIDNGTGWKIDLLMCKSRAFSQTEFRRRRAVVLAGVEIFAATVEDLIIAKLEWARAGQSQRQLEDVARLIHQAGASLDQAYLDHWLRDLGLEGEWHRAQELSAEQF